MNYAAIIDVTKAFEHNGVSGFRVLEIVREDESLEIMSHYVNSDKGGMFAKRKIHRALVDESIMEAHMMMNEVVAVPNTTDIFGPGPVKYEMNVV